MYRVVVRVLCIRQQGDPVVLFVIAVDPKIVLQRLVLAFQFVRPSVGDMRYSTGAQSTVDTLALPSTTK